MTLSIAACEYVGEAPTTPRLQPPTPAETTAVSTTDTRNVEPPPAKPKPKPAASHAVAPNNVIDQKPEPVYEERRMMTRAGPKWVRPATRGGPKWTPVEDEKPRVTREPVNAAGVKPK